MYNVISRIIKQRFTILIIMLCLFTSCTRYIKIPEKFQFVDDSSFKSQVELYDGYAIVLFYNAQYWQSRDMETRFHYFADKYYGKARFLKFPWIVENDASNYNLEMLPTIVLYFKGAQIDRIKGIPPEKIDRLTFNEDIDLWFMKNILKLHGTEFDGNFVYLFNNTHILHIRNN